MQPHTVYCAQIELLVAGYLTGIGMFVHGAQQGLYRLGVYDDNGGGSPGSRLAQTEAMSLAGEQTERPVTLATPIGSNTQDKFYWICVAYDVDGFLIDVVDAGQTPWASIDTTPNLAAQWVDAGLPDAWDGLTKYENNTPSLYLLIAQ
jgi:hypothetical protein